MRKKETKPAISIEDGNALDMYFADVSRETTVSQEEEQQLAERIRKGDQQAVDRLVTGNLRYVVHVAKLYLGQGLPLDDLINEGNIGLIKAAGNFQGGRFVNYAEHVIRAHIEKAIQEKGTDEASIRRQYSFDAPLANNERATMLDLLPNPEPPQADQQLEQRQDADSMAAVIDQLNEREQTVIKAFYGIGQPVLTLAEIGRQLGVSRERARQIRNTAIRKMKRV